ncbi:MAG: hypothetical protein KC776_42205 [Myxococcales bacterium]|nr:hypothetical protein [Myxococcales bacterium]MCB9577426.1 hypothetical protein [Polyangiaceae bacterium]
MGRDLVPAARRVLVAVANGAQVPWDDVEALVDGVLADETVALALAVREAGQHAVLRAVQLAAVIAAAGATVAEEGSGGSMEGGAS